MNHLVIPAKDIEVSYPSLWDEINGKHASLIGEIMYRCFIGKIDYDMARKLAVDAFLNRVNEKNKPEYGEESLNYWGNESVLADSVDFLFNRMEGKDGTKNVSINPKFCTQPVPYVKVGLRWYAGPKDLLSDLTIYEFKEASWRIGKYADTHDDVYLNEIFAVLYKRCGLIWGRKKGDPRLIASPQRNYDQTLKASIHVPIGIKFMVYLFFVGCMNWLREEAVEIDGSEIRFECLFPKTSPDHSSGGEKTRAGEDTGMAGILFQMAESGVFGNMEQTSKVSMWDVFLRLYQIHYQIKNSK